MSTTDFKRKFIFVVASLALSSPLAAQPNLAILDIQPQWNINLQAAPLAAPTGSGDESFEISLDIWVRNDELVPINLYQATYNFGPGISPSPIDLNTEIHMSCSGEKTIPLTENSTIRPGEECKILLVDDPRITPLVPQNFDLIFFFENYSPFIMTLPIVNYSNSQPSGGFQFWGSVDDLAPGEFWSTRYAGGISGHRKVSTDRYAYDAGVARYDADAMEWVGRHPDTNGKENEHYLVFGKPIYAMADGIVDRCEDGNDDKQARRQRLAGQLHRDLPRRRACPLHAPEEEHGQCGTLRTGCSGRCRRLPRSGRQLGQL